MGNHSYTNLLLHYFSIFQFVEHCGYGWGIPVLNVHTEEKITKNVQGDAYVRNYRLSCYVMDRYKLFKVYNF